MTDHAHELRRHARKIAHPAGDVPAVMLAAADEIDRLRAAVRHEADCLEACKAEVKALRAKIDAMEKRLRLILEEPENTLSNSKAMREMIKQARLALEESK